MPRLEILNGFHIAAGKGTEIQEGQNGQETTAVEIWTLVFTDRQTGDQVRISFQREARDELVRQLTGGIVLAGGELPKL